MADKYVSVSALRELLGIPSNGQCTGCQFVTIHGCKDDSLRRACEAIDDAPEADVRPVVHGEWMYEEPNGANNFKGCYWCDKCHQPISHKKNFCPNCGADMREVKADG